MVEGYPRIDLKVRVLLQGFIRQKRGQLGRQYTRDPGLIDRRRDTDLKRL